MWKVENNRQEAIHSGHFMVSQFEADAQEDDDSGVDPEEQAHNPDISTSMDVCLPTVNNTVIEIELSLAKLFKCMNLAYRWGIMLFPLERVCLTEFLTYWHNWHIFCTLYPLAGFLNICQDVCGFVVT